MHKMVTKVGGAITVMIEREVTIGNCRLIQGDMREILPSIREKADLICSDPPYRLTAGGKNSASMNGCLSKEEYDNSGELFDIVEWDDMAPLLYQALKRDGRAYVMTSDRQMLSSRLALERAGFRFHRVMVWNKITATAAKYYMPDCEFAHYMFKGRARTLNNPGSKQLTRLPQRDVTSHPTEKPVALMRFWIENSTNPGDLVIDPFFGSGSTLVAAQASGRRAIGIEKEPRWFDAACERLSEMPTEAPTTLFKEQKLPTQIEAAL